MGDPEIARKVLTNKTGLKMEKSPVDLYIMSHVVGYGLFSANGEEWVMQRRIINPFFAHESIKVRTCNTHFVNTITAKVTSLVIQPVAAKWNMYVSEEPPYNMKWP